MPEGTERVWIEQPEGWAQQVRVMLVRDLKAGPVAITSEGTRREFMAFEVTGLWGQEGDHETVIMVLPDAVVDKVNDESLKRFVEDAQNDAE